MKKKVFIQANEKQLLGAKVAKFTLEKNTAKKDFEIEIMMVEKYSALREVDGKEYLRKGAKVKWDKDDLQSFTLTRFLPPKLMNFTGRAVVIDPDVFSLVDINELFEKNMKEKAILCRRVCPGDGREAYWGTSVMLLDCEKLQHWDFEKIINDLFCLKADYVEWINLSLEEPSSIGCLEDEWNSYDLLTPETKLLHNTGRLTQPWKTGLEVDFYNHKEKESSSKKKSVKDYVRIIKRRLRGTQPLKPKDKYYRKHPDPKQEEFFFKHLAEAVEVGAISKEEIKKHLDKKYIRPDSLALVERFR